MPAANVDALKRLDWVINQDEYIQVVGMNNGSGSATQPLLGSSFNAIAVGLSNGTSKHGSYGVGQPLHRRPHPAGPGGA